MIRDLSLVYVGLAQNVAPLVTAVMRFFWTGERLKMKDVFMLFITFIGVSLITIGYEYHDEKLHKKVPIVAALGAFAIPFLLSYGNILMSTMKGLHDNTVSLYMNPFMSVFMFGWMFATGLPFSIYLKWGIVDWVLLLYFSVNTVAHQTLKYKAL